MASIINILKLKIMKRLKKFVKWYFENAPYAMMPSGFIPYSISDNRH
jgi:hypothetical protein